MKRIQPISSRLVLYFSTATAVVAAWVGYCGGQSFRSDIAPPPAHCGFAGLAVPVVLLSLCTCPWIALIAAYRERHEPLLDRLCIVVCVWVLMLVHIYGLLPAVQ